MKEQIIAWLLQPENLILIIIGLIQAYKLLRPYAPAGWKPNIDKAENFLSWAVPSVYNIIERLEAQGTISKNSKFSRFVDMLADVAKKQGVELSLPDILKAKLMAEGLAQASKAPRSLPTVGPQEPPITEDSVAQ